jgi:hypothetical protein
LTEARTFMGVVLSEFANRQPTTQVNRLQGDQLSKAVIRSAMVSTVPLASTAWSRPLSW